MDDFTAERERRNIETAFEAMGSAFGMDARCIANTNGTGATFSELDDDNNIVAQHIFTFAPTVATSE
jgi:hypothetical protein